jgi:hypothetical protein
MPATTGFYPELVEGLPHTFACSTIGPPGLNLRRLEGVSARSLRAGAFCRNSEPRFLRRRIHHQLLEPRVLVPQLLRFLCLTYVHPTVLRFPGVDRMLRNTHFPRHILRLAPCLQLLQRPRSSAPPCDGSSTFDLSLSFDEIILKFIRKQESRSMPTLDMFICGVDNRTREENWNGFCSFLFADTGFNLSYILCCFPSVDLWDALRPLV